MSIVLFDVQDALAAPVAGVDVTVYDGDTPIAQGVTGVGGTLSMRLPTGTYGVLYSKTGWLFGEDALTVVEPTTTAAVKVGTELVADVSGKVPDKVRLYGRVNAADHPGLKILVHVEVYAAQNTFSQSPPGVGIVQRKITIPADAETGYFEFDLPRGVLAAVKIPLVNYIKTFRVPTLLTITATDIEDIDSIPGHQFDIWT